jgi:hypothetical protein
MKKKDTTMVSALRNVLRPSALLAGSLVAGSLVLGTGCGSTKEAKKPVETAQKSETKEEAVAALVADGNSLLKAHRYSDAKAKFAKALV